MNGREDGSYAASKLQTNLGLLLTDKDGSVFFIDEGRGQTQKWCFAPCTVMAEVETLVQCSSGPFQSHLPVLAFSPRLRTLFISLSMSYTDESNTKTEL